MCRRKLTPRFGARFTEGTGPCVFRQVILENGFGAQGSRLEKTGPSKTHMAGASRGFQVPRLHRDTSADVLVSGYHGDNSSDRPVFNPLAAIMEASWS